jgi:hypothetical protein
MSGQEPRRFGKAMTFQNVQNQVSFLSQNTTFEGGENIINEMKEKYISLGIYYENRENPVADMKAVFIRIAQGILDQLIRGYSTIKPEVDVPKQLRTFFDGFLDKLKAVEKRKDITIFNDKTAKCIEEIVRLKYIVSKL